jgi:serine/threonine protein kinase/Tol biopolymer transport system component
MKSERWKQVEQLYHAALERTPEERAAFLAENCAADPALQREVEELLRFDGASEGFIRGNALAFEARRFEPEELSQTGPQLLSGQSIGAYKILSLLGRGGMGVVYRARDERLRRDVAIKVLPASFANDADRLRRFEQEAHATSALNHPNILTIYDIGAQDGAPFIVAELLEGKELREQLEAGALSARRALEYAQQITAGLAAAHEKGIVHRDLKPENLLITTDGRVKILDFGLAKLRPTQPGTVESHAPTQRRLTGSGVVMGTVGYMSPEQVRGQEADARSDIFAFGVILHEMLSGERPFHGASAIEVMNAILKEEPPELVETNAKISPQLEKLVRRCLEKQPERRFQSAQDLGFALETLAASSGLSKISGGDLATSAGAPAHGGWRERGWMIAAGALALIALALGVAYFSREVGTGGASTSTRAVRLTFTPPENLTYDNGPYDKVVVSPDGQKLAFTARSAGGKRQIWVRTLDSAEAQLLAGSDDPVDPFWSPDGRSLGYGGQGKLKRVDLAGGRPQTVTNALRFNGGSWNRDGVIIFAPDERSGLFQIPATGGEARQVTNANPAGQNSHHNPHFLPDGRHFLYQDGGSTVVGSLDSREVKQLLADGAPAAYAAPGWLLFVRNGALWAQRLEVAQLELKGEAVPLTSPNDRGIMSGRPFSVSENGVLIWQGDPRRDARLTWFDRAGREVGTVGTLIKSGATNQPRLSPDGKRVAASPARTNQETFNQDIWIIDLARDLPTRLTLDRGRNVNPIWSPDGSRVAYVSIQRNGVYQRAANGAGPEELLFEATSMATSDWSPDGRFIFFSRLDQETGRDLWVAPLSKSVKPYPLLNTQFDEFRAQLSPDGHWLAYVSDESGSYKVYVRPFTAEGKLGGDKQRISTGGGNQPRWRRDGGELFFVAADGQMMAVDARKSGASFEHGTPRALFKTRMRWDAPMILGMHYDVSADGQRFLISTNVGEAAPVSVILNWAAGLKK